MKKKKKKILERAGSRVPLKNERGEASPPLPPSLLVSDSPSGGRWRAAQ